jgi:hypothetical protein
MNIELIGDLLPYQKHVIISGSCTRKVIVLYCKPLGIIRSKEGVITGYEILNVFEVEDYLLGKNPISSRKETLNLSNVPDTVLFYFQAKEQLNF